MSLKNIKSVALAAAAAVGLSLAASAGVAKIDEQVYDTLDAALSAASTGQKVEVTADCSLTSPFVNSDKILTVDLGGKTVTYAGTGYAFAVTNEQSSLTIQNGFFKGTGEGSCFFISGGASEFELNTVNADQVCDANAIVRTIDSRVGSIVNCVIGGTNTRVSNAVSITGTPASKAYDGVTIEDSTIRTTGLVDVPDTWNWNGYYKNAALLVGCAKLKIIGENTMICGSVHAIYTSAVGGELQIKGGKYAALQDFFSVLAFDHPSHGDDVSWGGLNVTIEGGEFDGRVYVHGHQKSTLNITGGEFKNFEGWQGSYNTSRATMSITGGSFDGDPNIFKGCGQSGKNIVVDGVLNLNHALDLVATAVNKVGFEESEGQWGIVDAAQVSAVAGANSKLTSLKVDGEKIYDAENPVVGTIFPYSVSGMVVEGFEPVKMKVAHDMEVEATYTADEGYHFGDWEDPQPTYTVTEMAEGEDEIINLNGVDAELPPRDDDATWIGDDGAKWGEDASWNHEMLPSPVATVTFERDAVVDLDVDATINDISLGDSIANLTFMTTSDTLRTLTIDGQRYDTYYFYGAGGKTISYVGSNVAATVSTTCPNKFGGKGTYKAVDGATVTMTGTRASDNSMTFMSEGKGSKFTLNDFAPASGVQGEEWVKFLADDQSELYVFSIGGKNASWDEGYLEYGATDKSFLFSRFYADGSTLVKMTAAKDSTIQFAGIAAHAAGGTIDLTEGGGLKLMGDLKLGASNAFTLNSDGTGSIWVDSSSASAKIALGANATVNLKANPGAEDALFQTKTAVTVDAGATFNVDTSALDNEAGDSWEIPLADQGTVTDWSKFKPTLKASPAYNLSIEKEGAKAYLVIARQVPPTEYEWIRSNSKGYLRTELNITLDSTYEIKGQFVDALTGGQCIYSTDGAEDDVRKAFMVFYGNGHQASYYYCPNCTEDPDAGFAEYKSFDALTGAANETFEIRVEGNKAVVNGKELTSDTSVDVCTELSGGDLVFFQDTNNGKNVKQADFKLYYMKLYDSTGTKLRCEFIPGMKDGEVGLIERRYDEDGNLTAEYFDKPSAAGFTVGNDSDPTGPTVDGDAEIVPDGDGKWNVTPNGEKNIKVNGLNPGDKVTVPVEAVDSVAGVQSEDLILTVNGVEVDNKYFVGDPDGSGTFSTELGEAAKPVIGEEGVETPFVVGESAEVTIKAIAGLYYQLIRGEKVMEIGDFVAEKKLEGVEQTITLTDGDKPETTAFYKVGVTKESQMTNK